MQKMGGGRHEGRDGKTFISGDTGGGGLNKGEPIGCNRRAGMALVRREGDK